MDTDSNPAALAALLENHRAFLRYLERRVGERALAEDILQNAFAKVIAAPQRAPTEEAILPWRRPTRQRESVIGNALRLRRISS